MSEPYGSAPCPRLRPHTPVLQRGDGVIQVGHDVGLVLRGLPGGTDRLLRLLSGSQRRSDLVQRAARIGVGPDDVDALLARLDAAGLLIAPLPGPYVEPRRVTLLGTGVLATAIGELLARCGTADLTDIELDDAEEHRPAVGGSAPGRRGRVADPSEDPAEGLAQRLAAVVAAALPGEPRPRVVRRPHRSSRPTASAPAARLDAVGGVAPPARMRSVAIIASDCMEADRFVLDGLLRSDRTHLVVRTTGDAMVVGPLVVPGRTPCIRCTDLTRRDRDPEWPLLLPQLCRTTARPGPAELAWAAATTVTQALAHLGGGRPETAGATLELGEDRSLRVRAWRAHPECGCTWQLAAA